MHMCMLVTGEEEQHNRYYILALYRTKTRAHKILPLGGKSKSQQQTVNVNLMRGYKFEWRFLPNENQLLYIYIYTFVICVGRLFDSISYNETVCQYYTFVKLRKETKKNKTSSDLFFLS